MKQAPIIFVVGFVGAAITSFCGARDYFYGYRGGYHASTAAEGYQRGMADVIRSRGQANLMNARAAGYVEEARAKYLENRYRATEIYYERRKIHDQEVAAKRAARRESTNRYLARIRIQPFTSKEFDAATGRVEWPSTLTDSQWDEFRQRIDELLAARAKYGALSSDQYLEAMSLTKEWRRAIVAKRGDYPVKVLRESVRFIRKVDRELDQTNGSSVPRKK